MNDALADLTVHALQNAKQALADLRTAIDLADDVQDVFPLWSDLRDLTVDAMHVSDDAAAKCERLQTEEEQSCL